MRGGALFNGKEGRGDFRKKSLIKGKGGLVGFRKNPSLWQKKDGSSLGQFFAKSCSSMSCYSMLQGSSRY